MKKKIFNALLMGVLALTSVSTLVSCKDYDDDIDSLTLEQTDLKTKLEALQTDVNTKLTDVNSQISTINGSLGDLKTTVSAAAEAAKEAGATATAAETTANAAASDAAAAKEAAAAAKEEAAKALEAAGTAGANAKSALDQVTALSEKVGSLETLAEGIPALVEAVNKAATKEELKAVSDKVATYQNAFDNLFAMVTSVELCGSYTGNVTKIGELDPLTLLHGTVGENSVFGNDEAYDKSNPLINYTKGADIKQKSTGILVRVNPVNAELSTTNSNCKIQVINSLGQSLDDFVEVASVEKYGELITTRATNINSGLWKVSLQFKDGVNINAFEKAIANGGKNVLFAVAVNNTDTTDVNRYVASSYDLQLKDKGYEPADVLNYGVTNADGVTYGTSSYINGERVSWIQNRYGQKVNGELISEEYTWKDEPATAIKDDKSNVKPDGDDRSKSPALPVNVKGEFTITLDNTEDMIDYYYVTLDKAYAYESAPSEWNAWTSYTYEGLFETVKASEKHPIKITSDKANGDVIGFRVYAVNYDGTLVDPDGKAFYVQVGSAKGEQSITATLNVNEKSASYTTDFLPLTGEFNSYTSNFENVALDIDKDNSSAYDASVAAPITFTLYDKNKKVVKDWKDAKFAKVTIVPNALEDNGTFTTSYKAWEGKLVTNVLNITVTKNMPTSAPALTFKAGQLVNGVYNCYVLPTAWNADATEGSMNLTNVVNGLFDQNFTWTFADAKKENNKLKPLEVKDDATYKVSVAKEFIDNKTEHATTVVYNYKDISYKLKNGSYVKEPYSVPTLTDCKNTIFSCILDKSVMHINGWKKGASAWDSNGNPTAWNKDMNVATWSENITVDAATYLIVKNDIDGTYSKWNASNYKNVSLKLVSDENGEEDYFTVTLNGNSFKFEPKATASNPTVDVASTLIITCTDAFGHKMEYSVPFTVKKK